MALGETHAAARYSEKLGKICLLSGFFCLLEQDHRKAEIFQCRCNPLICMSMKKEMRFWHGHGYIQMYAESKKSITWANLGGVCLDCGFCFAGCDGLFDFSRWKLNFVFF
jgi:hypothetical protein